MEQRENERNYRYFCGLHLLLRFVVLLFINMQYDDGVRYLLLPLLVGLVSITYTFIQPYKQNKANLLEAIFFAILISIVMTFAPLNASYEPFGNSKNLVIFVWVLMMLPLLYKIGSLIGMYLKTEKLTSLFNHLKLFSAHKRYEELHWPDRLLEGHI